jgi:hypothetical protein
VNFLSAKNMEAAKDIHKEMLPSRYSRYPGRDLNHSSLEYRSEVLPSEPASSVNWLQIWINLRGMFKLYFLVSRLGIGGRNVPFLSLL